jgi:mannose-6-phosphate isomerase
MLTYSMGGPSINTGRPDAENPEITRYTPPVPEFEVVVAKIEPGKAITIDNPRTPSVMIVVEGSGCVDGEVTKQGRSYYWPSDSSGALKIEVPESKRGPLKVAIAHKNQSFTKRTEMTPNDTFEEGSPHLVARSSFHSGNKRPVASTSTLSSSPTEVSEFAIGMPDSPPHLILPDERESGSCN